MQQLQVPGRAVGLAAVAVSGSPSSLPLAAHNRNQLKSSDSLRERLAVSTGTQRERNEERREGRRHSEGFQLVVQGRGMWIEGKSVGEQDR